MSVYKRGRVWWYKFVFCGVPIRESAKTESKTTAVEAERARRRQIEQSYNGIAPKRKGPVKVGPAIDEWLATKKGGWAYNLKGYAVRVKATFGKSLAGEVTLAQIVRYQERRHADGAANRTINLELKCLRGALKPTGAWPAGVPRLREAADVGRAVSAEEEAAILDACRASVSPALYPAVVLSIHSGVRRGELRRLRMRDLRLEWEGDQIVSGELVVGRAKTEAGEGRTVPLSRTACAAISAWLPLFPGRKPSSYLFPYYRIGAGAETVRMWDLTLSRPMGTFARAWRTARKQSQVACRWHDMRHTFISRLLEQPGVSESTAKALAGHISARVLERYSHIRVGAKRRAIEAMDGGCAGTTSGTNAPVPKTKERRK